MYTHPKLKLQSYRHVAVPNPSAFFSRMTGERHRPADSFYGSEPIPLGNTVDRLRAMSAVELEHLRSEEEARRQAAESKKED